MKPEELADLIERLRQAGKNFPTLRMLTDDAEEVLRRVEKFEEALTALTNITPATEGDGWDDGFNACLFEVEAIARQALTGEA